MSLHEIEQVYAVAGDEQGQADWIACSSSELLLDIDEVIDSEDDLWRPLYASGVRSNDLAATISFLFQNDANQLTTTTVSYLISHVEHDAGILVPGDLVERRPHDWMTPRLFYLISGLAPEEFAQFELPQLAAYVATRTTR